MGCKSNILPWGWSWRS